MPLHGVEGLLLERCHALSPVSEFSWLASGYFTGLGV